MVLTPWATQSSQYTLFPATLYPELFSPCYSHIGGYTAQEHFLGCIFSTTGNNVEALRGLSNLNPAISDGGCFLTGHGPKSCVTLNEFWPDAAEIFAVYLMDVSQQAPTPN